MDCSSDHDGSMAPYQEEMKQDKRSDVYLSVVHFLKSFSLNVQIRHFHLTFCNLHSFPTDKKC